MSTAHSAEAHKPCSIHCLKRDAQEMPIFAHHMHEARPMSQCLSLVQTDGRIRRGL